MTKKVKKSRGTTALLAAMFSIAGISVSTSAPAIESGVLANGTSNLVLDTALHEMVGRTGEGAISNLASQFDESVKPTVYSPVQVAAVAPVEADPVQDMSQITQQSAIDTTVATAGVESPNQDLKQFSSGSASSVVASIVPQSDVVPNDFEQSSFSATGNKKRVALVQPVLGMNRQVLDRLSQRGSVPRKTRYITGHGERQDIVTALQMIVPSGWSAFSSDNGVKDAPLVSWKDKGRPWTETLNKVLVQSGMRAIIDWDRKEIDIMIFVPDVNESLITNEDFDMAPNSAAQNVKPEKPRTAPVPEKLGYGTEGVGTAAKVSRYVEKASDDNSAASPNRTLRSDDLDLEIARAAEAEIMRAMKSARKKTSNSPAVSGKKKMEKASISVDEFKFARPSAVQQGTHVVVADSAEGKHADVMSLEIENAEIASAKAIVAESQANKPAMLTAYAPQAAALTPKQAIKRYKATQFEGGQVTSLFSVKGSGYNIPLFTALGQVSPPGWFVYSKDLSITNKLLVAWRGGNRPWLDVLDEILVANNLRAKVNFKLNEIQITAGE